MLNIAYNVLAGGTLRTTRIGQAIEPPTRVSRAQPIGGRGKKVRPGNPVGDSAAWPGMTNVLAGAPLSSGSCTPDLAVS